MWVEAYKDGEMLEDSPIIDMSFFGQMGTEEKKIGYGLLKAGNKELFYIYGPNGYQPLGDYGDFISESSSFASGVTLPDGKTGLESGETKTLGVYRENSEGYKNYSFDNEEIFEEMIKESDMILLLRIKLEEIK